MTKTVAQVLLLRSMTDPSEARKFLEPRLQELTSPDTMADRDVAAERLAGACRAGEHICVFGDYDCDGMTSAAIMTAALRTMGARVSPRVASRFHGGYGVSQEATDGILETGATLVVTCDCGSSDHESLQRMGDEGREVIVIDHHLVPDAPLPALAFLNPHRPECGFQYKGLASCGLSVSVVGAVRAKLGVKLDLRAFLDLVAIGTIADVAPLDADNRALVRAGLEVLRTTERPGLRALLAAAHLDRGGPISSEDIAFRIAPRLNAPGRLGRPDPALELLLATDSDAAQALADTLEQLTLERRQKQNEMVAEALALVRDEGLSQKAGVVVGGDHWNHGIVGIVAARLVDELQKPVIVVGFEGDVGRGSARGPDGCRLYDALELSSEPLERWGGHQAAAGVTVRRERFRDFQQAFQEACESGAASPDGPIEVEAPFPYFPDDSPVAVTRDLDRVEPFGPQNPPPRFSISAEACSPQARRGGHLRVDLELESGIRVAGFAPNCPHKPSAVKGPVTAIGRFHWDQWRGGGAVGFRIDELELST